MRPEDALHLSICEFIRYQYPQVIFTSEPSGLRLPIGQATKLKRMRSGSKLPDLWILEPRQNYHGLFLEVKTETPKKRDGDWKTEHIAQQAEVIDKLNNKGYKADFVWSLDQAIEVINDYMNANSSTTRI